MKIVVLMGGRSLEREVSLKSGHRVYEALVKKGHKTTAIDVDENLVERLKDLKPEVAYVALHGKYGEDGTTQEILEILGIPYTGPGVFSNIVSFDKLLAKELFAQNEIATPPYYALSSGAFKEMGASAALPDVVKKIGLPLVVKPESQGSALGIKLVNDKDDLTKALTGALSYDDKVLLEKHIEGKEIAVSILGNDPPKALPIVEIETTKEYFDFESRYTMGATKYYVPARLSDSITKKVHDTALKVHSILRCRDVSRVDMILDKEGIPWVLELNTSPGMTETSLLPMAAKEEGIEFIELVELLASMAYSRK